MPCTRTRCSRSARGWSPRSRRSSWRAPAASLAPPAPRPAIARPATPPAPAAPPGLRGGLAARPGPPRPPLAIELDPALADEAALAIEGPPITWLVAESFEEVLDKLPTALAPIAADLLTVDRVASLVERAAAHAPVLVREVVPRLISLPVLADVLRSLAREQVPLADLAAILDAIARAPAPAGGFTTHDTPALAEQLRSQLRRQISARW